MFDVDYPIRRPTSPDSSRMKSGAEGSPHLGKARPHAVSKGPRPDRPDHGSSDRPDSIHSPMQTTLDLNLPPVAAARDNFRGRTFRETGRSANHRWYSYVEGFSADYLVAALSELAQVPSSIYDPFGGAGTALVEASRLGVPSYFAEANPFMAFVAETKVNSAIWGRTNRATADELLGRFREQLRSPSFARDARKVDLGRLDDSILRRDFFVAEHLQQLLLALERAAHVAEDHPHAGRLATLACASNIVGSSNMTRRADLRRRKAGEYRMRVVDVPGSVSCSVDEILEDLRTVEGNAETHRVARDCRDLATDFDESFELAVTSPPYLNGTNYIRNTKLELFLLGYIRDEIGLAPLRQAGVTGGITQAATSRSIAHRIDAVEAVAQVLDEEARDPRIPHLVRAYFSDMFDALRAVYRGLVPGGRFILDIGDSKFYGVHVPTDRLLLQLAESVGFIVERDRVIARRVSRDKSPLVQVDLTLCKPRT